MADYDFKIILEDFEQGLAPLAHIDDKTFFGGPGHAGKMQADIVSDPKYLLPSPGLANLTNGTQAGVVDQLIRFILEEPVSSTETYAIGTTKLFKLSSTTVTTGGTPSWPQAVTDMTSGESLVRVGANLFGFFNKASGGDILTMPISTGVIDPDWGSSTDQALENAPHPAATKEDIILFGNGRYVGTYIGGSVNTLDVQKLDFGVDAQVADIVFFSNTWWIAVNYGEGKKSRIFMYEAGALSNILDDEAGLGSQKIGFLFVHNGLLFIAYQDNTTSSFAIGFLNGRAIKPLRYFTGTLPDHRQKCLFKNTILFVSSTALMSCGATVEQISLQISKLADGGYDNLGGIGAPFGTPMVASSDGSTNHRLAKFSGYSTDSNWYSKLYDISDGDRLGRIMKMVVYTKRLGENARADITLEGNQVSGAGVETSTSFSVTGTKTRHKFTSIDLVQLEDFRVKIDSANGSTTNPCPIRKIVILGNYVQD